MSRRPIFAVREVQEAADHLIQLGFRYVGGETGHPAFTHPTYGRIALPRTPSQPVRFLQNFRSRLARKLGITKGDLERRLGLREEKREKKPKVYRQKNERGRRLRTFQTRPREATAQSPQRVGTPQELLVEVAREIEAVDQGLNYSQGDEYDSLLAERARLRHEYCQLEVDARAAA